MSDQLLQLEVRLLVLRYGRRAVLGALAQLGNQSLEEVESELSALEARKIVRKPRAAVTTESVISTTFADRPADIPMVEALVRRYENKTFLPQLRDVQRFIDRAGGPRGRLKSRLTALHQFIKSLSKMSSADIELLASDSDRSGKSDYELLAREIMGTSHALRPDRPSPESKQAGTDNDRFAGERK